MLRGKLLWRPLWWLVNANVEQIDMYTSSQRIRSTFKAECIMCTQHNQEIITRPPPTSWSWFTRFSCHTHLLSLQTSSVIILSFSLQGVVEWLTCLCSAFALSTNEDLPIHEITGVEASVHWFNAGSDSWAKWTNSLGNRRAQQEP